MRRDVARFLFSPISAGPLGLFRIIFGALVFAFGLLLFPDRFTWLSDRGVFPTHTVDVLETGFPAARFGLLRGPGVDHWLTPFFALFLLAALCLTLGLWTRPASVAVFLGLDAIHCRAPLILNGGDTFMLVIAAYLVLAPAGAACSLDRLVRFLRGREARLASRVAPWAQRLMQIQVSVVYLCTSLEKFRGPRWLDGTAAYYPLRMPEMARFPMPFTDGHQLWAVNLLTYGTLATELALATLVWVPRLRLYVLAAGVLLHLGIEYSLNVPLFGFLMISSYLLFLSEVDLRRFVAWQRAALAPLALRLVPSLGTQPGRPLVRAITFFDAFHLIDSGAFGQHSASENSRNGHTPGRGLEVVDSLGRVMSGAAAQRAILWRLPALWPAALLLFLPPTARLAHRLVAGSAEPGQVEHAPPGPTVSARLVTGEGRGKTQGRR